MIIARPLLLALASQLLLSSCAGHFTASQKEQMTAVHVPQARILPNSYTEPNFTSAKDASGANATSAVLGFGLVGGLVSEGIMAADRARDAADNKAFTTAIAQHAPSDLDRPLSASLQHELRATAFFSPRLSAQATAPARIDVTIKSHRLSSLDDTQYAPTLFVDVDVVLNNQSIRRKTYSNVVNPFLKPDSIQPPSAPLATYAASPQLLRDHFAQAARFLARDIAIDLQKTAGKP